MSAAVTAFLGVVARRPPQLDAYWPSFFVIDSLKKEKFSLKLKVHCLKERLQENNPEHVELALKQNINHKVCLHLRATLGDGVALL
ncbi:hypothetical protein AURDEDRAFT_162317 [Auricularia subglabra TFB-10046 SS5]|nr:hypothetical protein AURDEDRAFT_162317 [Auricularia subglabra TFB-10046 SS5]